MTETKIDGFIRLFRPDRSYHDLSAMFHLFEIEYDDRFRFWHGVADIAFTAEDLQAVGNLSSMVGIHLSDQRQGMAFQVSGTLAPDEGDFRLAFSGISPLQVSDDPLRYG